MKESKLANGRIGVFVPTHPAANNRGYVLRARYNMEKYLGRYLKSREQVHHKNCDKLDDRIENLEVLDISEHAKLHHRLNSSIHGKNPRKLDYQLIATLRKKGLGYKRISKITGYPRSSIQSACKVMKI